MSTNLDISQLKEQKLPGGSFPVTRSSDYRVYFSPAVHKGMVGHAKEDTSVEICGVVVGVWEQDEDGPYAKVTEFIRCDDATNKFAEVTFTHDSWTHINSEMDTKYPNMSIIGWYHSHPDFGIFLSDRDMFIQQNFFSGAGQFAFVVDPVRDTEGLFEWRANKAELKQHYWIGDEVRTSFAAVNPPKSDSGDPAVAGQAGMSPQQPPMFGSGGMSFLPMLLGALCLFLLGYNLAGWSNRWREERIIEGTVAHFGVYKMMHLGLEEPLDSARQMAQSAEAKTNTMLAQYVASVDDKGKEAAGKQSLEIRKEIAAVRQLLEVINERHALTMQERETLALLSAQKLKELHDPPPAKGKDQKSGANAGKTNKKKQKTDSDKKTNKKAAGSAE